MSISKITLKLFSGKGGEGAISFRREAGLEFGGPNGGNGGKGGDVIIDISPRLQSLNHLKKQRTVKAQDGEKGMSRRKSGRNGKSITIFVPPRTECYIKELDHSFEIIERVVLAKGGKGGIGNLYLATATNQAPKKSIPAGPAEIRTIILKLHLLGDIALIGMPNVGKSTLFNLLTKSKSKVGDYAFTTLEPKIGVSFNNNSIYKYIDMPGIIENAYRGKGLGLEFLEQIKLARILVVLLDALSNPIKDFAILLNELNQYYINKPIIVVFSKCDLLKRKKLKQMEKEFQEKFSKKPLFVSSLFGSGIKKLQEQIKLHLNKIEKLKL